MKRREDHEEAKNKRASFEVRVKVMTDVRKETVIELGKGKLAVAVQAPREHGEANQRVRELIAVHYGVEMKDVHIVRGTTSSNKTLRIN